MPEIIHVVLARDDVYSAHATSPQVPGLVIARPTWEMLVRDVDMELDAAGASSAREYHEQRLTHLADGRDYAARCSMSDASPERLKVLAAIIDGFHRTPFPQARHMLPDPLGVVLVIACVRSDRIRWLHDQMDPTGVTYLAVCPAADGSLQARQFMSGDIETDIPTQHGDVLHWTMGELLDSGFTLMPENGDYLAPENPSGFVHFGGAVALRL